MPTTWSPEPVNAPLLGQRDFADVTKLRILRWGGDLGSSMRPSVLTRPWSEGGGGGGSKWEEETWREVAPRSWKKPQEEATLPTLNSPPRCLSSTEQTCGVGSYQTTHLRALGNGYSVSILSLQVFSKWLCCISLWGPLLYNERWFLGEAFKLWWKRDQDRNSVTFFECTVGPLKDDIQSHSPIWLITYVVLETVVLLS